MQQRQKSICIRAHHDRLCESLHHLDLDGDRVDSLLVVQSPLQKAEILTAFAIAPATRLQERIDALWREPAASVLTVS